MRMNIEDFGGVLSGIFRGLGLQSEGSAPKKQKRYSPGVIKALEHADEVIAQSLSEDEMISKIKTYVRKLGREGVIQTHTSNGGKEFLYIADQTASDKFVDMIDILSRYRGYGPGPKGYQSKLQSKIPSEVRGLHTYDHNLNAAVILCNSNNPGPSLGGPQNPTTLEYPA